jgi:hypothetical protein
VTPVYSYLVISGWHGASSTLVMTVGITPRRYRIRAITRTKLVGRNRWLEPGDRRWLVCDSPTAATAPSQPRRDPAEAAYQRLLAEGAVLFWPPRN